jgi:hypothetical protein
LSLEQASLFAKNRIECDDVTNIQNISRRSILVQSASAALLFNTAPSSVKAEELREDNMYAPKFVQSYEDFTTTAEGWSYNDVKIGSDAGGGELRDGDRVVFDWSGYTIGYFGRPFEAKG